MKNVEFSWSIAKAAANERKHGVSFDTASKAMSDPFRFDELDDDIHGETRWRSLAMANGILVLLIVHTSWDENDVEIIRIISARNATSHERRKYEQNRIQSKSGP